MRMTSKLLGALTLVLFCSSIALADVDKGKSKGKRALGDPEATFKKLDGNADGKLNKDEWAKMRDNLSEKAKERGKNLPGGNDKLFGLIDSDKDGSISLDEFKKMREKMAERMKNKKGPKNSK